MDIRPNTNEVPDYPQQARGIPAARSNLWVARLAAQRYLDASDSDEYSKMLYYGAFFVFCRSALQALERSDGKFDPHVQSVQKQYFESEVKNNEVFQLLSDERHRIAHGADDWSVHPLRPMSLILRAQEEGMDFDEVVFDEVWVGSILRGKSIEEVMNLVWRTVSNWLDAIDAQASIAHYREDTNNTEN